LQHAEEIFATARQAGQDDCEVAILIQRDGGILMVPVSGWELEPLRMHHGASAAYRVSRNGSRVRVEARSAGETCMLQSESPARAVRACMHDFPQYLTTQ